MIGHTKISVTRKGGEIGRDRYGNPIYAPDETKVYRGEFFPLTTTEAWRGETGGTVANERFRVLLPPSATDIAHNEHVQILGRTFRIVGVPEPFAVNGRVHHYEFEARAI
ncbi:hypothetical protein MHY20_00125 [Helcobacillus sp. ACRRO]|uniref:hypothetical protein n=1 Tax=Helcobacillus sp. ACRRO TaxID=2918202 RepID=UPI001EF644B1|nr:hypothetical protein [Helcobacillus sp. ACRRO]MCG7426037.1 hypothetical protein [Helcobacillus sp. ACRRO]